MTRFMLVMNRDSYDALDAETQAKLEGMTGAEMSQGGHITMSTSGVKALEKWEAEGGEVVRLSPEAAAEFDAASAKLAEALIAELEGEGIEAGAWAAALKQ